MCGVRLRSGLKRRDVVGRVTRRNFDKRVVAQVAVVEKEDALVLDKDIEAGDGLE